MPLPAPKATLAREAADAVRGVRFVDYNDVVRELVPSCVSLNVDRELAAGVGGAERSERVGGRRGVPLQEGRRHYEHVALRRLRCAAARRGSADVLRNDHANVRDVELSRRQGAACSASSDDVTPGPSKVDAKQTTGCALARAPGLAHLISSASSE